MHTKVVIFAALFAALFVMAGPVAADDGTTEMGICVVGADSPCNSPEYTDNESAHDPVIEPVDDRVMDDDEPLPDASEPIATADEPIQFHPDELPYASQPVSADDRTIESETPDVTTQETPAVEAAPERAPSRVSVVVGWFKSVFPFF